MSKETISQTEGLCKEVATCVRNAYDRGYKQGYKDGYEEGHHYGEIDGVMNVQTDEVSYQRGLEDAWECVKKITYEKTEGGFDFKELKEIFDGRILLSEILVNYSATKAMKKIREYEESSKADDEIKVGDEVMYANNIVGVISRISRISSICSEGQFDTYYTIMQKNGDYVVVVDKMITSKTGRHFNQIEELLKQIGVDDE